MKHRLLFAAATTALLAAPSLAMAQDSGVYIKGQVGYGVVTDADLVAGPTAPNSLVGGVAGQGNLAIALGLGYDFGENWRVELEGETLYNDLGSINGQPSSFAKLRADTLRLNLLYDFSNFGRWEPYVGAGVGLTRGKLTAGATDFVNDTGNILIRSLACVGNSPPPATISGLGTPITTARGCQVSDRDTNFSWNLMAGLGYDITDNLSWDTNYTYTDIGDFNYDGVYNTANPVDGPLFGGLETQLEGAATHVLKTGFRYRFGKSTPAPVIVTPPPAPETFTCWDGVTEVTDLALCPAQTYTCWDGVTEVTDLDLCPPQMFRCDDGMTMVSDLAACPIIVADVCEEAFRQEIIYYEFDRGQSAETRNTINRILDIGQFCQIDNIRVVGHTDTSGPASYNMGLSERRASDAREELVRQGVNGAIIMSEGKGETEPFVQTGDGVREQLNRRTEVLLQLSNAPVMSN